MDVRGGVRHHQESRGGARRRRRRQSVGRSLSQSVGAAAAEPLLEVGRVGGRAVKQATINMNIIT